MCCVREREGRGIRKVWAKKILSCDDERGEIVCVRERERGEIKKD